MRKTGRWMNGQECTNIPKKKKKKKKATKEKLQLQRARLHPKQKAELGFRVRKGCRTKEVPSGFQLAY